MTAKEWLEQEGYKLTFESGFIQIDPEKRFPLMAVVAFCCGLVYPFVTYATTLSFLIGIGLCGLGIYTYFKRPTRKYVYPDAAINQVQNPKNPAHFIPNNEILVHTYDVSSYATATEEGNRDYGCELYYEDKMGHRIVLMDFHSRKATKFPEAKKIAENLSQKLRNMVG